MMQKREGAQGEGRSSIGAGVLISSIPTAGKSEFMGVEANKPAVLVGRVKWFEFNCSCFFRDM